jgi:phenylacetate-CoA ligase
MYRFVHHNILTPLSDLYLGWGVGKSLRFLKDSQWWSAKKLQNYQLYRLRLLLRHAYDNTTFYKNLMDGSDFRPEQLKTLEDLKKLPIISKAEVQAAFPDRINAINQPSKSFLETATSGSTGRQLIYNISKKAYGMINAAALRGWSWMEFELGDKYVKISQNHRKSRLKKIQDKMNRSQLVSMKYNEKGFADFIKIFNSYQPKILRSYPDPLVFISNYLKEKETNLHIPEAINTTGNILTSDARKLIESTFRTKIFDSYSCEGSTQLFECPTHCCYHASDEYAITEILNEDGNEVNTGERGRLITTDLWNFATPFIRYDTQDYVVRGGECTCGRGLSTVSKIDGRDNDILKTPKGTFLIAQNFTTYFKYFSGIEQFQVVQEKEDELIFKFVINDRFTQDDADKIVKDWTEKLENTMTIKYEKVSKIPVRFSGKRQFLVRDSKIKL